MIQSMPITAAKIQVPFSNTSVVCLTPMNWLLKTMKRLPAKEIAVPTDPHTEQKVQHLAEDSVHEADIVTEAMAEVWLKQGNRQKALETYSKLSLQNPSKRAYFATLIENLKRS